MPHTHDNDDDYSDDDVDDDDKSGWLDHFAKEVSDELDADVS